MGRSDLLPPTCACCADGPSRPLIVVVFFQNLQNCRISAKTVKFVENFNKVVFLMSKLIMESKCKFTNVWATHLDW